MMWRWRLTMSIIDEVQDAVLKLLRDLDKPEPAEIPFSSVRLFFFIGQPRLQR
jgi:hypothetical protein